MTGEQPVVPQPAPQPQQPAGQPQQPAPQPQQPVGQPQQPASQPAPQPQQPAPQQPVRHHVHHSYIWLGSIQTAFMILVIGFFSASSSLISVFAKEGLPGPEDAFITMVVVLCIVGSIVLVIGIVALYQWASYKHLYYELGAEEFSLYAGIFNKKRTHVPYQRIQSVDQRASLLQRIFGVCTVNIDTAGGASNKAARVPYVQKAQAEELRRELFARKQYQLAVQSGIDPAVAAAAVAQATGVGDVSPSAAPSVGAASVAGVPVAGMSSAPTAPATGAPIATGAPSNVLDAPAEIWDDVRGVFAGMQIDTGKVTYEYGLSNKELVLTGLSNNTAFLLIIVGIVGGVAQLFGDVAPLVFGSAEPVVGQVVNASVHLFGGNLVALVVAALVGAAAVMWVVSTLGTCVSYGGFRACRRDSRIEVEHGLLQHRFQGVDIDRVQSITVKQSFIRRLMGYCELSVGKIDAASDNPNDQQKSGLQTQGLIIHPFVKLSRVPEILAGIAPEFADVPVENTPVARVGLRRAIIRRSIIQGTGLWLAVFVAITQLIVNMVANPAIPEDATALYYVNTGAVVGYALCAVLFVLDVVGAVLWFRGSGFAYNKRFMQVSNGGFARETISFPRKKIQFGYTRANPFQRHAHTVTVSARTAAGIGGTTVRLIDVCEDDAAAWLTWLKPHRNVVE